MVCIIVGRISSELCDCGCQATTRTDRCGTKKMSPRDGRSSFPDQTGHNLAITRAMEDLPTPAKRRVSSVDRPVDRWLKS
jgi:hypothetical protein